MLADIFSFFTEHCVKTSVIYLHIYTMNPTQRGLTQVTVDPRPNIRCWYHCVVPQLVMILSWSNNKFLELVTSAMRKCSPHTHHHAIIVNSFSWLTEWLDDSWCAIVLLDCGFSFLHWVSVHFEKFQIDKWFNRGVITDLIVVCYCSWR